MKQRYARLAGMALLLTFSATQVQAACPLELAVYSDDSAGVSLDFRPGQTAVVTNSFKMALSGDVLLDGVVMWTEGPARPVGLLMKDCPEGDVTGEEIAACTAWEGSIYAADDTGTIGLLPAQGEAAPHRLVFADLARGLAAGPISDTIDADRLPSDVFTLSGCQE
ncbi:hypothetical protein [Mesorhizobium sp. CAU 1732]|uniref:hypothetical protein n=1 Tax=Mesorhizobium sp. CAU 1732 TaxID=3140358 RepID=UPI0032611F38